MQQLRLVERHLYLILFDLDANKYYYLGVSWDGGIAQICRGAAQKPPFDIPIGQICTGTVNLGGFPPANSIVQTRTNITNFVQKLETGKGSWLQRTPVSGIIKPLENMEIPLKFYATDTDTLFSTNLKVTSNDVLNDTIYVPIYFGVGSDNFYIICEVNQIDDNAGNGNNEINIAEKISLPIKVKNFGSSNAENVYATISSTDEYFIPVDDNENIGTIEAGRELIVNAFEFEISPYCPDNHELTFKISFTANNYQTSYEFTKTVTEAFPTIDVIPDTIKNTISLINDSLTVPITITNNGYGRLIYKLENPVQQQHNIGMPAENLWLPIDDGVSNVYKLEEAVHLLEIQSFLVIDSCASIYFFIYEGDLLVCDYTLIAQNRIDVSESGAGWYSSGIIDCDMSPKKYYYIGASWKGSVKAGKMNVTQIPLDIWAGELISGGYGLAGVPPKETINQRFQNFAHLPAQRLITGSGWWLNCPTIIDTLFPKETNEVVTKLYALFPDTTFITNISIISNDPVSQIINIPITLTVTDSATGFVYNDHVPPQTLILHQNYPNPFNMNTKIRYNLIKATTVELTIYNILGQKVKTLVKAHKQPDSYEISWNGKDNTNYSMPSGIYLLLLKAGGKRIVRKILVLK